MRLPIRSEAGRKKTVRGSIQEHQPRATPNVDARHGKGNKEGAPHPSSAPGRVPRQLPRRVQWQCLYGCAAVPTAAAGVGGRRRGGRHPEDRPRRRRGRATGPTMGHARPPQPPAAAPAAGGAGGAAPPRGRRRRRLSRHGGGGSRAADGRRRAGATGAHRAGALTRPSAARPTVTRGHRPRVGGARAAARRRCTPAGRRPRAADAPASTVMAPAAALAGGGLPAAARTLALGAIAGRVGRGAGHGAQRCVGSLSDASALRPATQTKRACTHRWITSHTL